MLVNACISDRCPSKCTRMTILDTGPSRAYGGNYHVQISVIMAETLVETTNGAHCVLVALLPVVFDVNLDFP